MFKELQISIAMEMHESKIIELHGKSFDVDLNMIELIIKLNKNKLITRGCCENYKNDRAYIIFEYISFNELLQNEHISKFINDVCTKGKIYYSSNGLRHLKYDEMEYNENFKNITEIWICVYFPNSSINDFVKIE